MTSKTNEIKAPTKWESLTIRIMILIGVFSLLNFIYFFFQVEFRGYLPLYIMLSVMLIYGMLKKLYLWYHYFNISVPQAPHSSQSYTVDILTTYFPGEPYEMILETLESIQNISYPHTTYLCDEADDPYLKAQCIKLGVLHVTRVNRINAKAGNINNALKQAKGDICVILDPDHIPNPDFLDTVLPYFADEGVGYVQVVQAYYNKYETLVARGAAEQTFQFYGPMMMTMNSYGTVNAIGANCTFRRAALDSIGGHAPGLAEDMHTAMLLHAEGWQSVYVPKIVAKGLAPSDLTSYFKQQLKWSRGCFELLYSVYPKIFKKLTWRQRLHYGVLPLHYLLGLVYLFSFLIPIFALMLSKMPWTGNIIYFLTIIAPVFMSSLLIRTYIQKWVIEKSERGFHVIGGLLQLIAWWVFLLGVVYTFIRKKVPYLPTPKDESETNLMLVVPNLVVGILSLFAIVYGLHQDLNPFSIIMSFFAFLNAIFMFFSLYLAIKVTNRNRILRSTLEDRTVRTLKEIKRLIRHASRRIYAFTRPLALPLLMAIVYLSSISLETIENNKWDEVKSSPYRKMNYKYMGIFNPSGESGISDLGEIERLESVLDVDFQIVSSYIAWGNSSENQLSQDYLQQLKANKSIPMITWEPWINGFVSSDSLSDQNHNEEVFRKISSGAYDNYVNAMALKIRAFKDPVFMRFAHEFNNPFYPWSASGDNTPEDFKIAWRYLFKRFQELNVDNVRWVWNPWEIRNAMDYYPGDDYVDWIGLTLLNYGSLNQDGNWHNFDNLFKPWRDLLKNTSIDKPIMLCEFGSTTLGGNRDLWLKEAFSVIDANYSEVQAVVFFNSRFDKNVPKSNMNYNEKYIDWSMSPIRLKGFSFFKKYKNSYSNTNDSIAPKSIPYKPLPIPKNLKGIGYKKGTDWINNYYVVDKRTLQRDFELMSDAGINCIRYVHSQVYDYNILKYSKEHNISVLYTFWVPEDIDFTKETLRLNQLSEEILDKIEVLKEYDHIIGWNIGNDNWSDISVKYDYAEATLQHHAYVNWLEALVKEIKILDPQRFLTKDIRVSQTTEQQLHAFRKVGIAVDAYGLLVNEDHFLEEFLHYAKDENLPFMVNSIDVATHLKHKERLKDKSIIIRNWQNQWEVNKVTFDGVLDFEGRIKMEYLNLARYWNNSQDSITMPKFKILRPAMPLHPNDLIKYEAMVYKNNKWVTVVNNSTFKHEWNLVKTDRLGNALALKKLGNTPTVEVKIPNNYQNYALMLNLIDGEYSHSKVTQLNTPLEQ